MADQEIQYGKQPPKNPDVDYGKTPETSGTHESEAGDSAPSVVGVVPVYAGGDDVPTGDDGDGVGEGHTAADAPDDASGDEEASDASNAPREAEDAADDGSA